MEQPRWPPPADPPGLPAAALCQHGAPCLRGGIGPPSVVLVFGAALGVA